MNECPSVQDNLSFEAYQEFSQHYENQPDGVEYICPFCGEHVSEIIWNDNDFIFREDPSVDIIFSSDGSILLLQEDVPPFAQIHVIHHH